MPCANFLQQGMLICLRIFICLSTMIGLNLGSLLQWFDTFHPLDDYAIHVFCFGLDKRATWWNKAIVNYCQPLAIGLGNHKERGLQVSWFASRGERGATGDNYGLLGQPTLNFIIWDGQSIHGTSCIITHTWFGCTLPCRNNSRKSDDKFAWSRLCMEVWMLSGSIYKYNCFVIANVCDFEDSMQIVRLWKTINTILHVHMYNIWIIRTCNTIYTDEFAYLLHLKA